MANELLYVPGVGTRYFYDKNKLGTVLLAEIGASNWKSGLVDGHPCFTLSGTAFKFTTGSAFTGSHTVEYWLKLDGWTNAGTTHLFGNSRYNNFYGVAPVVVSGGNNISLKLYFDFTGSGDQTTTVTLPDQSGWVHIAAVYEYSASNYKVNLYVNGTKVAEHYLQLMGSMRLLFGGSITGDSDTTLHDAFVGKMANIIVTSGLKYTETFTPAWDKVDVSGLTEGGDKMHNFTSPEIEYLDVGNVPYKIPADLSGAQNSRGLAIGQLVWSQSSLAKDNPGCLPLWTGEYYANASTLYPDFYTWVKSHPELCKTKAEYDELVNTAQGCLFYVLDEVEGSLRLPKYKLGGRVLVDSKQPTATSPSWYNLYSDGWLEQGSVYSGTFNMTSVHNLLIPFADTNYSILGEALDPYDYAVSWTARKTSFTTTSFTGEGFRGTTGNYTYNTLRWEAKGYAANTPMENIMYPWIVSFTAAVPASTAQAAEFTGALAGKANMDLSNVPNASKSALLDLLAKDTATWATLVNATDFVAPSAGWINYVPANNADATIGINTGWSNCCVQLDGKTIINQCYCYGKNGTNADAFAFFVGKGQTVKAMFGVGTVYFYPCKGAE